MTGDQTPVATEADFESLSRKLRAMTETLTPVERSILEALLRATGRTTDEEVEGYLSFGIYNPFGGTVSIGPDSVRNFFGFGSSSEPTQVVIRDRSGSSRDPRSERHQHR
jgi:hypothetical protein